MPIGNTSLPHLGNAKKKVREIGNIALAIAILMIGGALALSPDRKTFRRAGRRIAFLAIGPVLIFAVAPKLLQSSHAAALVGQRGDAPRVRAPGAVLGGAPRRRRAGRSGSSR